MSRRTVRSHIGMLACVIALLGGLFGLNAAGPAAAQSLALPPPLAPDHPPEPGAEWTNVAPGVWHYRRGDESSGREKWFVAGVEGYRWYIENYLTPALAQAQQQQHAARSEMFERRLQHARQVVQLQGEAAQTAPAETGPAPASVGDPNGCHYARADSSIANYTLSSSAEAKDCDNDGMFGGPDVWINGSVSRNGETVYSYDRLQANAASDSVTLYTVSSSYDCDAFAAAYADSPTYEELDHSWENDCQ